MNNELYRYRTDSEPLRGFLQRIAVRDYRPAVRVIIESCRISRSTFVNWRYGRSKIPPLAKQKINEVTEVFGVGKVFEDI